MDEGISNKVAASGLVEIDLENFYPQEKIAVFDLRPYLFMDLILKEKDFREALRQFDFSIFSHQTVAVTCTADAIIPVWAYMLVASYLQPVADELVLGSAEEITRQLFLRNIRRLDISAYEDKRVVIKGCGDLDVGPFAYFEITTLLRPVARSIMYGEPCSTVPVFKKSATPPSA